ncbi:MAG: hypothetical protein ACXVB0_01655 [Mucilaginibacter sp.]
MQDKKKFIFPLAILIGIFTLTGFIKGQLKQRSQDKAVSYIVPINNKDNVVISIPEKSVASYNSSNQSNIESFVSGNHPILTRDHPIGVIELRNYVMKSGLRDTFINFFEKNFVEPQDSLNGFILGRYRVKDKPDNFCWVRGFENMDVRSQFLPAFYHGPVWKRNRITANNMLANNDNVYLLRPMGFNGDSLIPVKAVSSQKLLPKNGITVVEFYIANSKLGHLIKLFTSNYLVKMKEGGYSDFTIWTSEMQQNDFPKLPVFQDKNLMAVFSFFKNEKEYLKAQAKLESSLPAEIKADFDDTITIKNTWILYPSEKSLE